jgi:hypothetical protein
MHSSLIGRIALAVFAATVVAAASLHGQGNHEVLLDLVGVMPPPDNDPAPEPQLRVEASAEATGRVIPADTPGPRPVRPVGISLESLDRTRYVVGDPLVYEVVITNTSGQAFAFPTSIDPRIVRRGMPGARLAAVSLAFDDEVFGGQLIASKLLYGANAVPGTIELLQPGDTLRIRASGAWWLGRALKPGVPSRVVRDLAVSAHVILLYLEDDHGVIKSPQTLPIQLQLHY